MGWGRRWMSGLLAGLLAGSSALAERSRLADETDVAEPGDCELEFAAERRRARGEPAGRELSLLLGCGVGAGSEVAVAFARQVQGDERLRTITVEARTVLVGRRPGSAGWMLVYGLDAERPAEAGWKSSGLFVGVEATRQFGADWLVEAGLGIVHERQPRRRRTTWLLGLEKALVEGLEWRAAIEGDDRERPFAETGLRWLVWENGADLAWSFSVGQGGGPPRERRVGLALTIEF